MSRLLSLALCCVLVPLGGRAEEAPAPAPASVQDAAPAAESAPPSAVASDAPLRKEEAPSQEEPPTVTSSPNAAPAPASRRVVAEILIGGGGLVVVGLVGQAVAPGGRLGGCAGCARDYNDGFILGAGLGAGLGVYATGRFMGGQGDFLATMAGAGLGTAGAFLMLGDEDDRRGNARTFTALALPLAGAIAAYEVSSALSASSGGSSASREAPRLVPVATATREGGVLGGLAGSF